MVAAQVSLPSSVERAVAAVASAQRRVDVALAGRWRVLVVALAALAQTVSALRVLSRPGYPRLRDSRIFEYVGWQLARGTTLYVETFEVKPPLSFETTAALSILAGDDQLLYHHLNVALTCVAAVVAVALVAEFAYAFTGEPAAAVAAGLTPYVLPQFALRSGFGFKAKYLVLAAGLLALWLAHDEGDGLGRVTGGALGRSASDVLAGAAAAAAVGYWQLAAVVPLVVLGMAARRGRGAVARVVAGGALASLVVLAPVLAAGVDGVVAMLNQTVLVSQYAAQGGSALDRAVRAPNMLHWGRGLFAAGLVGLAVAGWRERGRDGAWPVAACGAWFLAVVVAFDLDAAPDLFPTLAFVAVGIGLVAGRRGPAVRGVVLAVAVWAAVVNVAFLGGFGVVVEPFDLADGPPPVADPGDVEAPYSTAEHHALLWYGIPAETCHVFYGPTQQAWVEAVDGDPLAERCRTTFP
ncbi:DolP-mannose mannosyltransferase [Halorubellus sp. PRR65]|uniref:DolP-mannose mannosyltransferase n=1 Tax=Halorubellus sp. PRR65 TaxID=3098148 RepID=UPI002B25D174|nr:DolP-mannose mannosyltransferase [Halorubellus sp. PRR65]